MFFVGVGFGVVGLLLFAGDMIVGFVRLRKKKGNSYGIFKIRF